MSAPEDRPPLGRGSAHLSRAAKEGVHYRRMYCAARAPVAAVSGQRVVSLARSGQAVDCEGQAECPKVLNFGQPLMSHRVGSPPNSACSKLAGNVCEGASRAVRPAKAKRRQSGDRALPYGHVHRQHRAAPRHRRRTPGQGSGRDGGGGLHDAQQRRLDHVRQIPELTACDSGDHRSRRCGAGHMVISDAEDSIGQE
jgi:hypothetical protein